MALTDMHGGKGKKVRPRKERQRGSLTGLQPAQVRQEHLAEDAASKVVHWRHGKGRVRRIDAETYSLSMAVVEFAAGEIYLPICELEAA